MKLERFQKKYHAEFLRMLLDKRGLPVFMVEDTPEYGIVALKGDVPVSMAFIRSVEGGFGMIDGLITNSDFSSADRHEALNMVVGQLIEAAREFKMKLLMAFTVDEAVKGRADGFKFERLSHTLIKLDLGET